MSVWGVCRTPRAKLCLLRHAFGQSVEEIAELTQVSPDTVRDRLLLARREFRRRLVPARNSEHQAWAHALQGGAREYHERALGQLA